MEVSWSMDVTVAKFGGTSVADSSQIKKIARIIHSDVNRRIIIVSAPGKRNSDDQKITDILIACHSLAKNGQDFRTHFAPIRSRFHDLAKQLNIGRDMDPWIDEVENDIAGGSDKNMVVSRGEYLAAQMISRFLGFEFVDATELIAFHNPTELDQNLTDQKIASRIKADGQYVIPGFYGALSNGHIQLFTRGGSDISAALVARAVEANLYENWTDVSGLLSADPRYVDNPAPLSFVSYRELRELAFLGAAVFHAEAVAPVAQRNIVINIRNTNHPDHPGTMISADNKNPRSITGVAGKSGFHGINLEKTMLDKDPSFAEAFKHLTARHALHLFHRSTGCESLFAVLQGDTDWNALATQLQDELGCSSANCGFDVAMVGAVGENISSNAIFLSRAFEEFHKAGIRLYGTRADYSAYSLMFFVSGDDESKALNALYRAGGT